ncbi:hypothetical protein NKJ81_22995 [Mesorhizobium sp. M0018]|uniref:hypothetical protein n=1 Tax=unclassified Mesorhizobium TaxID=325217 RepID=UPI003334FC0E
MMVDLLNIELPKARQRVKRAELSLQRATEMLDKDCGVGINIALCDRIRSAQRRLAEARERLVKIDSTCTDCGLTLNIRPLGGASQQPQISARCAIRATGIPELPCVHKPTVGA